MACICLMSAVLAYLDYITGAEMAFGVLYLVPVLLAAAIHQNFGIAISFLSGSRFKSCIQHAILS